MIFDASTLPRNDSLTKLARPPKFCELPKLKDWWMRLPEHEQAQILSIDSPDIINDFTDTVNTAFLLFKLHSKLSNKTFISIKRQKDQSSIDTSFFYEFKFLENESISKDLAQLFSCYELFVNASSCKNEPRPDHITTKDGTKSCITVKKEYLASIFNIFSSTITNFAQGKKIFFNKEHDATFFSFFTKHAFIKLSFSEVQSSSIQELYYKLLAITLLFENNLYLSYSQKVAAQPISRLVNTSKAFFHTQAITPAKLELQALLAPTKIKKSNSPALSGTSSTAETCDSNSRQRSFRNVKPFCPSEETFSTTILKLGKQASQESVSEVVANTSMAVDHSVKPEIIKEKGIKEQDKEKLISCLPKTEKREMSEGYYFAYDGFIIDNLEITFEAEDDCLMDVSDDESERDSTLSDNGLTEVNHVSKQFYPNGRGYRGYGYQRQSGEVINDVGLEQFPGKDSRWQNKGKTYRYGKFPRGNKENNRQEYDPSKKEVNKGEDLKNIEENPEEFTGESESNWKGYRGKENVYGENKGKWRGKGRNEIVYRPKGEYQKGMDSWNVNNRGKKFGEEKGNRMKVDRVMREIYVE